MTTPLISMKFFLKTKIISIGHEIIKNQESVRNTSVNEQDSSPDF